MNWFELSFHTTHEACDLVSDVFMEAGSKGVLLEDSKTLTEEQADRFGEIYNLDPADYPSEGIIVKGYLAQTPGMEQEVELLRTRLLNLEGANAFGRGLDVRVLDEEDWANSWKRHYHPIEIIPGLVVKPSWLEPSQEEGVVEILLDPGMAFGSGTHETTQLCLELLAKYQVPGGLTVDVGTGSGVLALAASKLGALQVYATDLDGMAVIRARENVVLNGCGNIVVEKADLLEGLGRLGRVPDLMVANILAPIIIGMLPDVAQALPEGRTFICSGIVSHEKDAVLAALGAHGFGTVEVKDKNGWVAIVSKRS